MVNKRFKLYNGCKYVSSGSYKPGVVNSVQWYGDSMLELTDGYSVKLVFIDNIKDINATFCASFLNKQMSEV